MTEPALLRMSEDFFAAPQLKPESLAWLADHGFKSVINNRPDFEGGPDQPTSATMQAEAEALGLQYVFLPVSPSIQTEAEIARFAELLDTLPAPVLAFCRTGTRSGKLYNAAQALRR